MYRTTFRTLFACAMLLACVAFTHAQTAQRTFVSTSGNDANVASLCSRNAPCRGFSSAISVVTAGGEVVAIDSGGYGAVTITKSVQLIAPTGVYAAITQSGAGNAVTVNAAASDIVVLRGLTLNGINGATNGIDFNTAGALHIENCTINGFGTSSSSAGILFDASGRLFVKDTIVRNCGSYGVLITAPTNTAAVASIDRSRFENNANTGLYVFFNAHAVVKDSVAAGNIGSGFLVGGNTAYLAVSHSTAIRNNVDGFGATGGGKMAASNCTSVFNTGFTNGSANGRGFRASEGGEMSLDGCVALNNDIGIAAADQNSVLRVSTSTATNNNIGFFQGASATFESRGNNTVRGNAANVLGTITPIGGT